MSVVLFSSVDEAIDKVLQNFVLTNQTTADNLEEHRSVSQSYIDALQYDEDKQKFQFFIDNFFMIPSNKEKKCLLYLEEKSCVKILMRFLEKI